MPIFEQADLKIIEITFLNLHHHAKKQFIPSIYSWDTESFRVLWPDWPHPFLVTSIQKPFDQFLIYVNLHQHAKDQVISMICSGDMVD